MQFKQYFVRIFCLVLALYAMVHFVQSERIEDDIAFDLCEVAGQQIQPATSHNYTHPITEEQNNKDTAPSFSFSHNRHKGKMISWKHLSQKIARTDNVYFSLSFPYTKKIRVHYSGDKYDYLFFKEINPPPPKCS